MRDPQLLGSPASTPWRHFEAAIDGVPLDQFYDLREARLRLPGSPDGRPPHISKVYRLVRAGDHGVRLRALRWPGRMVTCDRCVAQFLEEVDRARRAASEA